MDNCCEFLIPMKKDAKTIGLLIVIWLMLLAVVAVGFVLIGGPFPFLLAVAAVFGGVWLTRQLNVEYEYIFTNGEMDIDLITNKSSRKRLITFKCKDIERIEKYSAGLHMFEKIEYAKKSVYCNAKDENLYCISFKHSIGKVCLVLQLEEKMREAIRPYLDKSIAREAFM
jgi:hypothetical protein